MGKEILIPGFSVAVARAGLKKNELDMALVYSERPAVVAGCFTQNRVKAAPVILTQRHVKTGLAQAIVINSGNANACTGEQGQKDAHEMASLIAKGLNIPENLVLVCSTGVIGSYLPMDKVRAGINELFSKLGSASFEDVARAIMTTDTFPKMVYKEGKIKGYRFRLLGIAKGAGMIQPNMATMLAFFLTDIYITPALLQPMFQKVVSLSFNRISVDGDTSTNDTALALANGYAQNPILKERDYASFKKVLLETAMELAKMIAKDGEGASKLIEIHIKGLSTVDQANQVARTIANSPLVKTAIYGGDANWGRIMAAIGRCGIDLNPEKVDIYLGNVHLVKNGLGMGKEAEDRAQIYLKNNKEVLLVVDFKSGQAETRWYTCDLTEDYIRINASYRT